MRLKRKIQGHKKKPPRLFRTGAGSLFVVVVVVVVVVVFVPIFVFQILPVIPAAAICGGIVAIIAPCTGHETILQNETAPALSRAGARETTGAQA
jgi:hypothetical protein